MQHKSRENRKPKSEFDHKLVDIARVARVVAGGRRFRFRGTVVIGDHKGRVGIGMAKGKDVSNAVEKATNEAKKNLIEVPIVKDTIPHEVLTKYCGAKVLLKPARPGTGIIAGGAIRPVIELAGIKNIISKMFGSSNKANNVKATIKALQMMVLPKNLEKRRGNKVYGTFQNFKESKPTEKIDTNKKVQKNSPKTKKK